VTLAHRGEIEDGQGQWHRRHRRTFRLRHRSRRAEHLLARTTTTTPPVFPRAGTPPPHRYPCSAVWPNEVARLLHSAHVDRCTPGRASGGAGNLLAGAEAVDH